MGEVIGNLLYMGHGSIIGEGLLLERVLDFPARQLGGLLLEFYKVIGGSFIRDGSSIDASKVDEICAGTGT